MAMRGTTTSAATMGVENHHAWEQIPDYILSFTRPAPRRRTSIVITELDERRLRALARRHERYAAVAALEAELTDAAIVDPHAVPPDVVTMNSRVVYRDSKSGASSEVRLVYPNDARGDSDISVLTPLGTALLGVKAGQEVTWSKANGSAHRLHVSTVAYQPERSGDFHL